MLSVDAPAFHPGAASESRQPEAQAGPSRAGKSRSRRHPKPPSHHVPAHRPAEAASHEQASSATEADDEHDGENEVPMCLLCCGPMTLTSFGSCNHKAACGRCCLRMRMCYDSTDCPLCKAELKEVVIAPWRPDLPDFAHFKANPEASVRARGGQLGPGTVLVDRWVSARRPPSSRLLHDLVRSTGIACAACDPTGHHPFSRYSQLEGHVKEAHGCFLCGMCLREGRNFPLDAPLYPSEAEMKEHAQAAHPRCSFCRGRAFFDGDALWRHMQEKHFRCQLCEPAPGGDFPWYNTAHHLQQHLAADHFACDDPDCATSLVAFATAEELKRHYMERHSSRMMRWNPAASRPLHLDIQFVRRPGEGARPGGRGRDRERQAAGAGRRQRDFAREVEGGFTVIDDDLGMQDGADWPAAGAGSDAGPFVGFPGYSGRRRGEPVQSADAFPSLAAVAAEAVADNSHSNGMNGNGNGAGARRRPPPLVKRTVRCPCGRKVTHHVVEEGQEVPALECDAVCNLEGRRAQLADAFGIEDREHHTSAFDRRPAEWSGALLAAAKKDRAWVEGIERELASFLANKTLKRYVSHKKNFNFGMHCVPKAHLVVVQ